MDQNQSSDSSGPAPETKDTSKAPDVSMSMDDSSSAQVSETTTTTTTTTVVGGNPGHGLGIASLVFSILGVGLVGIILGALGLSKSKKAGQKNGLAVAGIIVGVLNVIVVSIIIAVAAAGIGSLAAKCAQLGSGTHVEAGITYTCS